jgi:hypothetical protein
MTTPAQNKHTTADVSAAAADILGAKKLGAARALPGRYIVRLDRNGLADSTRETGKVLYRVEGTVLQVLENEDSHNKGLKMGTHAVGEQISTVFKFAPDKNGYGRSEIQAFIKLVFGVTDERFAEMNKEVTDAMSLDKSTLSPSAVELVAYLLYDMKAATPNTIMRGGERKEPFVKVKFVRVVGAEELRKITGIEKFYTEEQLQAL